MIAAVADELRARGRRPGHLRDQPEHQLHQPVLFPLRVLRLQQGPAEPQPPWRSVHARGPRGGPRSVEAAERGATEVCLQGGIHPDYTGDFYVSVLEAIKKRLPDMHVHGFTPLEVWQGAETLGVSVRDFLAAARRRSRHAAGHRRRDPRRPGSRVPLSGQGDDRRVGGGDDHGPRARTARPTTTLMCGHIDGPRVVGQPHRGAARHPEADRRLHGVRTAAVRAHGLADLSARPARPGPTWDEVVLLHAVPRIAFDGLIPNIQASWVKLGLEGGARLLPPAATTSAAR